MNTYKVYTSIGDFEVEADGFDSYESLSFYRELYVSPNTPNNNPNMIFPNNFAAETYPSRTRVACFNNSIWQHVQLVDEGSNTEND